MDSAVSEKQWLMPRLSEVRKTAAYYLTQPIVWLLAKTPITPSAITWFGFLLAAGAAALITTGHLFAAGFVVLTSGFFDMLDGALARRINQAYFYMLGSSRSLRFYLLALPCLAPCW